MCRIILPSVYMQALLNQSLRSSVGTGAEVHGRSFGRWDKYNANRIFLFQLLYNMYPWAHLFYFVEIFKQIWITGLEIQWNYKSYLLMNFSVKVVLDNAPGQLNISFSC